jgi:hypothetical protein
VGGCEWNCANLLRGKQRGLSSSLLFGAGLFNGYRLFNLKQLFSRLINSLLFSDGQRVRCALCGSGIEQIDGVNWRSRANQLTRMISRVRKKSDRPLAFHKGAEGSSEPL